MKRSADGVRSSIRSHTPPLRADATSFSHSSLRTIDILEKSFASLPAMSPIIPCSMSFFAYQRMGPDISISSSARSVANLPDVNILSYRSLSTYDVLSTANIVFTTEAIKGIEARLGDKK